MYVIENVFMIAYNQRQVKLIYGKKYTHRIDVRQNYGMYWRPKPLDAVANKIDD